MEWPQITMIVLFCIRLYLHANNHGEKLRYGYYDFGSAFVHVVITAALLHYGGFWS